MVYNNTGYPSTYQPMVATPQNSYQIQPQPQMQSFQQTPKKVNVVWAQGEDSARAYPIEPNTMLIIFDTNGKTYYTKSSDISGFPSPLEVYDYHRRGQENEVFVEQPLNSYDTPDNMVTKDDIQTLYDEITSMKQMLKQGGGINDSKQPNQ